MRQKIIYQIGSRRDTWRSVWPGSFVHSIRKKEKKKQTTWSKSSSPYWSDGSLLLLCPASFCPVVLWLFLLRRIPLCEVQWESCGCGLWRCSGALSRSVLQSAACPPSLLSPPSLVLPPQSSLLNPPSSVLAPPVSQVCVPTLRLANTLFFLLFVCRAFRVGWSIMKLTVRCKKKKKEKRMEKEKG